MEKLSYAYKIGSRLALTKHLPNLSRNQRLALGGVGGGLGALGLGLSAVEGKVLAKSLADDAVGAASKSGLADDVAGVAGKSGLVDDAVSAAGIHGPDYEKFRALNRVTNQIEHLKGDPRYRDINYSNPIMERMINAIKGPGHISTSDIAIHENRELLKKQFPGSWERLNEAIGTRSEAAFQAARKATLGDLEGMRRGLSSPGTQPEEVAAIWKKFNAHKPSYDLTSNPFSLQQLGGRNRFYQNKQISTAVEDLLKTFSQKK